MEYQDACGTAARAAEFADFVNWSIFLFSWNLDTGTYVLNLAFTTAVVGTKFSMRTKFRSKFSILYLFRSLGYYY